MKKRLISLLLTVVMLLSLMAIPANAALVSGTGTLTITPNVTSVKGSASAPIEVIYTIKVTPPAEGPVGEFHFNLKAPDGMTLSEVKLKPQPANKGGDGYWVNMNDLWYNPTTEEGVFETFEYTPASKYFQAFGTSASRNMTAEAEIMTIKATIAAGKVGDFTLTAENVGINKNGTDSYSVDIKTTPVTVISAISNDLPVAIAKPEKGVTPETAISGTNYTGSIAWTPTVTGGKFAANTEYTANVTLTAKTGYQFASDVNPTVTNATSVTDKNVAAGGKTLTFKAAFPQTGNKTLKGIDIITNPPLTVAVPTAAPNATATNERSLAVTGVYDDGSGGPVAVNWEIMTTPIPKGVSLVGSTLKVTNEAEAGTFMIKATSTEGHPDSETVTITKEPPAASAIVLTAPTPATVAVPKSDTPNEIDLPTATVYDQYGKPIATSPTITYDIEGGVPTGVTLTTGGKMKVYRAAQDGEVKVIAKLGTTLTSDPVTYTITRETSQVTSVSVIAPEYIMYVPKVTKPGTQNQVSQQFNPAKVLDQYGQEMTGQTVTWNVANDAGNSVTGVSIDNNGKLTVTNEAPAITVYVTATCSSIVSNKSKVTINKDAAKATLVEIYNQADGAPETSLLIPAATFTNSEAYTAKVYDQYGAETGGMVDWALVPATVPGVELDTTTSTGNAILKVYSTAAPGTIQLIANCSTLGSTASKTLDITLTNKTPASVTTAPKAVENLKYTGDEQALVTVGAANGGTMQYSLGSSSWSTEIPTAKDAGTYSVQYKVVGDATHTDTTPVTLEVTIAPKTLTKADLTPTGSTSKVYDGTTNSSIPVGVKVGVLYGADTLSITGSAVYNSADVNEANTITFTPNAITTGNYRLAASEVLTIPDAKITPKDLTVTPNAGQSKKFGAVDPTLHSTNSGRVPGQIPDFTGALSRAEGEDVGQYDITQGTLALMDHFSSGFKASNYTLKMVSPAEKFEITKADAPTLKDITDSQKYTVTTEQNKDIGTAGMPANAGTLTYAKGTAKTTGTVKVDSWSVDATTGKVTYTLSGGAASDTVTLPVIIKSTNYADATVNVVITLTKPSSSGGGGSSHSSRYTITVDSVKHGTITVSPKSAYKGDTVTVTVKPDKGYELDTLKVLDKDGDKVKITEKKGKYTFTMPASKVTIKGKFVEEAPEQIFADVPVDAYCYEAVKWAASEGITGGIGNNLFAPGLPCTRGQIVTFLWRAAGSPAPKSMSSFADVPADAYYAKAVAWAVENGITGGTGDGKFSPDATCTRAQAVTFLYRASGSPAVSGSAAFSDVAADAYYASAVKWAEKNGITGGIGGGLFGSGNNCTRGQIVTFLYRSVK